jgi:hypothetical protein
MITNGVATKQPARVLTAIPPLMFACCKRFARASDRFDYGQPFVSGSWVWATDRAIVTRQVARYFDPPLLEQLMRRRGEIAPTSKVENLFLEAVRDGKSFELPAPSRRRTYDVGPVRLASRYVELLRRYGVTSVRATSQHSPVWFEVDGIEGLLMPLE